MNDKNDIFDTTKLSEEGVETLFKSLEQSASCPNDKLRVAILKHKLKEQAAEIERLRSLVIEQSGDMAVCQQERDQLKASLERLQKAAFSMLTDRNNLDYWYDLESANRETPEQSLAIHDADVIERAIIECGYMPYIGATRICTVDALQKYANQLRASAEEVK